MYSISPQEITLTETVLGKGAFGEVRVAYWRNIAVAYKKPHIDVETDVDEYGTSAEDSLQQEIQVLSQLRHPNLVLFIGTCRDPQSSKLSIITELLPTSLYDMLEVGKMHLSLPDILDIGNDIISGLEYLHGHNPVIVHRDISSKNILIGGNRAKIADLGQAKIFSNISNQSRQSKLPGAMAYAAPETLTGKYFSPIDIFSFGILLSQMCTGEYPRIDRREEQIQRAIETFPLLKDTIEACVHYQPPQRPIASAIAQRLRAWKENDRHYPISRRQSPEKDVGVLALHWMHQQIEEQTNTLRVSLHQQTQLLQREEERWRSEASSVDTLQKELNDKNELLSVVQAELQSKKEELREVKRQLRGHTDINEDLKSQLKLLSTEQEKLLKKLDTMEGQMASDAVELQQCKQKCQQLQTFNQQLEANIHTFHTKQEQLTQRESLVHRQLDMQVNYARDVEERLEQTLVRWREEHEQRQRLDQEIMKLNRKCSDFLTREIKLKEEKEMIERRLAKYEGLPVPEEIKARLNDLDADNNLLRQAIADIEKARDEAIEQYQTALQELMQHDVQTQHLRTEISTKEQMLQQRDQSIEQLKQRQQEHISTLKQDHARQQTSWEEETTTLKEDVLQWAQKCKALETELAKSIALTKHFQKQLLPSMHTLDELVQVAVSVTKNSGPVSQLQLRDVHNTAAHQSDGCGDTNTNTNNNSEVVPPTLVLPPAEWTVDESILPKHAVETAAAVVAEAERKAQKLKDVKPIVRLSDIAVKHLVERTLDQRGLRGLIALLHHPQHNQDERVMWRAARMIREQIVKQGDTARQICATSYGGAPIQVTGKELTAAWRPSSGDNSDNTSNEESENGQKTQRDETQPLESDLPAEDAAITPSEVWCVRLLQVFPECIMLQAQALRIIGTLAFQNDVFRRKIGEQHGVFYILQAMQRHYHASENVILYGATALTNICHASNDNRSRFLEYDGVSLILDIMDGYLGQLQDPEEEDEEDEDVNDDEGLAHTSKSKGKSLNNKHSQKKTQNAKRTKPHRRELLAVSMTTLSRIFCQCCYVILTVAGGSDMSLAERIVEDDGHALILKCLAAFREDAEMQQYGLWALYNLAIVTPSIADSIAKLGGIEYCQMIVDIYTASFAQVPVPQSTEVIRQAHATLQVLLKTAMVIDQSNHSSESNVASNNNGNSTSSTKLKAASSNSKAAQQQQQQTYGSNLILPAISVYSATQTVVSNQTGYSSSASGKKKKATSAATNASSLLSKSTSHL